MFCWYNLPREYELGGGHDGFGVNDRDSSATSLASDHHHLPPWLHPFCKITLSCRTYRKPKCYNATIEVSTCMNSSREDLEDLLNDPAYFQAIFHSLERVKDLYRSQAELGLANETIARMYHARSLPFLAEIPIREQHRSPGVTVQATCGNAGRLQ